MKRYILIFLLGIYFKSASAQSYFALPDSNATWIMGCDNGFSGEIYPQFTLPFHKQDTVINSITYTKFPGIGAFRNNGAGITYIVPNDSLNEYVLENLTKNVGDTINKVIYGRPNAMLTYNFVVDSINYISVGPYSLKRMFLHSPELSISCNISYPLIWIEKIGCPTGGFINEKPCDGLGECGLYCMSVNDTTYWLSNTLHWGTCYSDGICLNPTDVKEIAKQQNNVIILPNPTNENIILEYKDIIDKIKKIELYNYEGCFIKSILSDNKDEVLLSCIGLPNGLYFIKTYTENSKFFINKLVVQK